MICASVLQHLGAVRPATSCFLTRDRELGDSGVGSDLAGRGCKLFFEFPGAAEYIRAHV